MSSTIWRVWTVTAPARALLLWWSFAVALTLYYNLLHIWAERYPAIALSGYALLVLGLVHADQRIANWERCRVEAQGQEKRSRNWLVRFAVPLPTIFLLVIAYQRLAKWSEQKADAYAGDQWQPMIRGDVLGWLLIAVSFAVPMLYFALRNALRGKEQD